MPNPPQTDASDPREDEAGPPQVGALSGVRVLDLTSYLAGPYATALLGDLGAEIVKIESPAGDMMRNYPSTISNESRSFLGTNRNKRSLTLDLKKPEGHATFLKLVERADVVVHNFRPSVPKRLKIDYDTLRAVNPQLVYCAITGFGDTGPAANNAGFDQVLQSMTGMCTFQGGEGEAPEIVLGSVVDFYTASLVAYGVAAALYRRKVDGKGQYIGSSLLRSAITMQSQRFVWTEREDRAVNRDIRLAPLTGIHPTKEGYLYLSTHSRHFWDALCAIVGMPDYFLTDPRFETMRSRIENAAEIIPTLHEKLAARTAVEWAELFGERVPNAPVRPIEDMFDHPQVIAQDLVTTYHHPVVGSYRGMTKPLQFSRTPGAQPTAAPVKGQHTVEILRECGLDEKTIAHLRETGAVEAVELAEAPDASSRRIA